MNTEQLNKSIFLTRFDQRINEQKVNELYIKYQNKVYTIALSYVKDNYLAEDLAHEILVKCYLTRKKFNGDCSFHSWIYRIAINHCIDFLRRSYRHRDLLHEDLELLNDRNVCTTESEVLTIFDKEELRNKLRLLPSKYEEVIMLYYFKDLSLKEIEHHLNIKLSTIKTRLFRAKRMLREMY
ncbi:sigma-70 family RNA polymerase sigma factor [Aquibacillus halophilus]|uniref:Sigma-70 family RNA polymerase sigma factor n=1 Tax=Aquibacillus halophilus TaxID=930132 RepID=A0A6A8DFE9_9BACI|nr:sigma-70 family RNA polymerase sigma factor [Aquibacillus halophilus]MRH42501.1 sigma-70 family RNA polymerase sigma factor [Aquibacillus halophilus]